MTDQSPGNSEQTQTISAIECSLADAHKKLSKLYDIQRASRIQLLVLVGGLVVVMLIFGVRIYSRVKTNFSQDQVRAQLLDRLPIVGSEVARQFNPVLHEVAPVYVAQLKNRIVKIAPDLRDDADEQIKLLPPQIHEDVMGQLEQTLNRVANSIQQDAKKTFPYLNDDRAHDVLQHFVDALHRESKNVTDNADVIVASEMHKVYNIFSRFDVPPLEKDKKDQSQVERELIHHLLLYMDSELMAQDKQ